MISFQECHNKNEITFDRVLRLESSKVEINDVLNPHNIHIFDSLLFIQEEPRNNKALKILSLNDFSIVSESGNFGRGPGEMVNPGSVIIDEEKKDLWICDLGKFKWFKFPIDSILSERDFKPTESFDINIGLVPMLNSFSYTSGNIGFSSYNLRRRGIVFFTDYYGNLIDSLTIPTSSIPGIWDNINDLDNPYVINYNRDYKRFIIANRHRDVISIIDEQGNLYKKIEAPINKRLSTKDNSINRGYITYYTIFSDEDYIYCLYVGDHFIVNNNSADQMVLNYPKRLLVFDWDGRGRYDIELDHELIFIALDFDRNRLIGYAEDYFEGFVIYDLEWLN